MSTDIKELIDLHQGELLHYAYGLVKNQDTAQDVVQDAYIKYLKQVKEKKDIANVRAWLYRVTHNNAMDHLRKFKRVSELEPEFAERIEDKQAAPDKSLEIKDASEAAVKLLGTLPEREQQIITLKVMEDKSYKEIAEIMGITSTNVGFILHSALKKLRTDLKSLTN
ncbi:MAG: RNA polymerase sigma factor [Lentisphaeria bacterium]|nr:RNA polymerase sigma factor [Lentisphaeria bacterium]NQZ66827.1 RNA polymerase sigma factor [Lentisphaeria bacterium]